MKNNITIKFIAEKAGVSTTTISRYINGKYEYMSEETKKNIEEIITLYNYRANKLARGLKSKKSKLIGIVISTLKYQVASHQVRGMHEVLVKNGFSTIIYNTENDESKEKEALQMCLDQQVDGIVLMPNSMNCEYYTKIHNSGTPIVMYNRYRESWKYDGVYINNAALTSNALVHMFNNGYEKIAFLTDNIYKASNKTFREEAFIDFASKYMNSNGKELIFLIENQNQANDAISNFIKMYPSERKGLFAINSDTLFFTIKAINSLSLSIPNDMAVCGFDAHGWSEIVKPGITSLEQPSFLMGTRAAELLIRNIKNKEKEVEQIWLEGSMSIRDSTRKF